MALEQEAAHALGIHEVTGGGGGGGCGGVEEAEEGQTAVCCLENLGP